jgi:hypothetical protein
MGPAASGICQSLQPDHIAIYLTCEEALLLDRTTHILRQQVSCQPCSRPDWQAAAHYAARQDNEGAHQAECGRKWQSPNPLHQRQHRQEQQAQASAE